MSRTLPILVLAISGLSFEQTAAGPQFEVVSVKPSSAEQMNGPSGITTGHGRLSGNNVSLKRCIMGAFGVQSSQILGGPVWLDSDRFEIVAKAGTPENDDAVLTKMLQALLSDRFRLSVHRETRTLQALLLETTKNGPKLETSADEEAKTSSSRGTIDARKITMDRFAEVLARQMDLPVVNRTGIAGVFDLKLQWTPEGAKTENGPSIYEAIQQQLGLRLRSEKVPFEMLVIDHAEKPTEN